MLRGLRHVGAEALYSDFRPHVAGNVSFMQQHEAVELQAVCRQQVCTSHSYSVSIITASLHVTHTVGPTANVCTQFCASTASEGPPHVKLSTSGCEATARIAV